MTVGKSDTSLCLSFSFYDGATNSPPTVVIVKIITFTSQPEGYWKAQEKEMYVDICTIQAAPPSRQWEPLPLNLDMLGKAPEGMRNTAVKLGLNAPDVNLAASA